jgi:thymidylate kinase
MGYHSLVAAEPDKWIIIDASQDRDSVQDDLRKAVDSALLASHPRSED